MKIGILTQPIRSNYGGILQNWALQQVLITLGHKPFTFRRYDCTKIYKIWRDLKSILSYIVKHLIFHRNRKYNKLPWDKAPYVHTEHFIQKNIKKITYYGILRETDLLQKHIKLIIVGSDQVWRPLYNKGILSTMYCEFLPPDSDIKPITYAASFGVDTWEYSEEEGEMAKREIQKFKAISVREQSGADICLSKFNREAIKVLDPTLLIDVSIYSAITYPNVYTSLPKQYIGVYILDITTEKRAFVEKVSKALGFEAIYFGNTLVDGKNLMPIERWLATIKNCSFMITDSFHGTVFSILFQKEFLSIVNPERGADRIFSLLETFNLTKQIVDLNRNTDVESLLPNPICWSDINTILQAERQKSLEFLKNNIS